MEEPNKILVAGDFHGNWVHGLNVIQHAFYSDVDTIVHVGDFTWVECDATRHYMTTLSDALADAGINLYWIDGNHDPLLEIQQWMYVTGGEPYTDGRYPNITYLPRCFRWTWWGQEWLALGGAVSVDRHMRSEGRSWWPEETITDEQMNRAMAGGPVDIMVTHDAPTGVSIPGIPDDPLTDTRGHWPMSELIAARKHRDRLATVVDAVQPKMLLHGHYHVRYSAVRRSVSSWSTAIHGLDCDGSSLADNTLILTRNHE